MGSHICIVKKAGDLRRVLLPFADDCDITKVSVEYTFTGEYGFIHIARAAENAEAGATVAAGEPSAAQHGQEAISRCECYDNGNKPCLVVDRRFSNICAVCGKQLP